jgi:hypothetical protein
MEKEELIQRIRESTSVVDFYGLKNEILRQLGADSPPRDARKKELEKLKMGELREIGKRVGASDSDKAELIEEILSKEGL